MCATHQQDNTHRLTLKMSPDEAYLKKQAEAEEKKLQEKIQLLTDDEKKEIYEKGNKIQYRLEGP